MPPITKVYAYKTGTFNQKRKTIFDHLLGIEGETQEEQKDNTPVVTTRNRDKHLKKMFNLGLLFGFIVGSLMTYVAFY